MSGILDGIRVVEVASMAAAPSATVILADLGAEVIKIEPPSGDLWRYGHGDRVVQCRDDGSLPP